MSWDWLEVATVNGLVGLAVLVVLWPTEQSGTRFLQRWGISRPTRSQSVAAARYLRHRRLLYPVLFLLTPLVLEWGTDSPSDGPAGVIRLLAPVIAALLTAEVVAALRPVRGVRVASLTPRSWRDLLPSWAVVTLLALTAFALVLAGAGLIAQPWADRLGAALPPNGVPQPPTDWRVEISDRAREQIVSPTGWLVLAATAVCLTAVLGLVRLTTRRPADPDTRLDAVLRTRTARVAVGIGIAWMAGMANVAVQRLGYLDSRRYVPHSPPPPPWLETVADLTQHLGLVLLLGSVVAWIRVTTPAPRRSAVREAG